MESTADTPPSHELPSIFSEMVGLQVRLALGGKALDPNHKIDKVEKDNLKGIAADTVEKIETKSKELRREYWQEYWREKTKEAQDKGETVDNSFASSYKVWKEGMIAAFSDKERNKERIRVLSNLNIGVNFNAFDDDQVQILYDRYFKKDDQGIIGGFEKFKDDVVNAYINKETGQIDYRRLKEDLPSIHSFLTIFGEDKQPDKEKFLADIISQSIVTEAKIKSEPEKLIEEVNQETEGEIRGNALINYEKERLIYLNSPSLPQPEPEPKPEPKPTPEPKPEPEEEPEETRESKGKLMTETLDTENWSNLREYMPWKELVRSIDQPEPQLGSNSKEERYWKNNAELREEIVHFFQNPHLISNTKELKYILKKWHSIAVAGKDGKRKYRNDAPPGVLRTGGKLVNSYVVEAKKVDQIAHELGDSFTTDNPVNEKLNLSQITSLSAQPANYSYHHEYPSADKLEPYFEVMRKELNEFAFLPYPPANASLEEVVTHAARFYRYAVNARPFKRVNNSLFMNIFNTMLEMHGYKGVSHQIHDHVAHRIQDTDKFVAWMIKKVKEVN